MRCFQLLVLAVITACHLIADEVVTCRNLKIYYDIAKLQEELELVEGYYIPHQSIRDNWTAIPLRNATGTKTHEGIKLSHTLKHGDMLPCQNSEFLDKLPYITSILEDIAGRFETEVGLVRISRVGSQRKIEPHSDGTVFDLNGKIYRLHIPIITGEDVIFEIEGKSYHLEPGALYYTNVAKKHAVYNNGSFDRVHLLIDVHASPIIHNAILSAAEAAPMVTSIH